MVLAVAWCRYLAWTSAVGDFAVVFGAAAVIGYGLDKYGVQPMSDLHQFRPSTCVWGACSWWLLVGGWVVEREEALHHCPPPSPVSAQPCRVPQPLLWFFHACVCVLRFVVSVRYSAFFGQSVFLFAVHSVVLPISQAMRHPRKFDTGVYGGPVGGRVC